MTFNSQYANLCLLSLEANIKADQKRKAWVERSGLASNRAVSYLQQLIIDCRMEEHEHRQYMAQSYGIASDDCKEMIEELKERLNPTLIYIPTAANEAAQIESK